MAEHAEGWPLLDRFMARHNHVALMFSAGKDSAACLRMVEPWLDKLTVIWANPGRPYPEVVDYMAKVRARVPRFVEAKGDQPRWIRLYGHPTDMLPFAATTLGQQCMRDDTGRRLCHAIECRNANMWQPAQLALGMCGATGVIKGEKLSDRPLPPVLPTFDEDRREYFRPLLNMTDEEVFAFLGDDLPPGYADGLTGSLDCMDCTAFLARNPNRLRYLRVHHPEVFDEVRPVLLTMFAHARDHGTALRDILIP